METNDNMKLLLDMQEHPERYSDEALRQMLEDEDVRLLMEATALGKRAMMRQEMKTSRMEEWKDGRKNIHSSMLQFLHSYRVAATFLGLLLMSGIAFAAIHIALGVGGERVGGDMKPATQEVLMPNPNPLNQQMGLAADTTATVRPVVFDNIPLEQMLPEIAAHYADGEEKYTIVFRSDEARQLRFYFIWDSTQGIEHVVADLNRFEHLHVTLKERKIIVED